MKPWRDVWIPVGTQLKVHEETNLLHGASDPEVGIYVKTSFLDKIAAMNFRDLRCRVFETVDFSIFLADLETRAEEVLPSMGD